MIKKIIIGLCIAVIGGVIAVGCSTMMFINSWNTSVDEYNQQIEFEEQENKRLTAEIQKISIDEIEWELIDDGSGWVQISGNFYNSSDKEIEYLELDCKAFSTNGNVVATAWTNESNISPGETRKITIDLDENNFDYFEITVNDNSYFKLN